MKYSRVLLRVLIIFSGVVNSLHADEEILLDSDEKAQEVLLGKVWKCEWKDNYSSGTSEVIYEQASLKKVTAKIKSSYCPNGWGKYKGKIKKGRESGRISGLPSPCQGGSSTSAKIFLASDGSYYSEGQYRPTNYQANGKSKCVAEPLTQ